MRENPCNALKQPTNSKSAHHVINRGLNILNQITSHVIRHVNLFLNKSSNKALLHGFSLHDVAKVLLCDIMYFSSLPVNYYHFNPSLQSWAKSKEKQSSILAKLFRHRVYTEACRMCSSYEYKHLNFSKNDFRFLLV